VVAAEYAKLTGSEEDDVDVVGDDGSGEEGDKRKKKQSLSRTLKNKLNKLCEKTDERFVCIMSACLTLADQELPAGEYSPLLLWNPQIGSCMRTTTKSSRNLCVLK
jgi:hypothetical protein